METMLPASLAICVPCVVAYALIRSVRREITRQAQEFAQDFARDLERCAAEREKQLAHGVLRDAA